MNFELVKTLEHREYIDKLHFEMHRNIIDLLNHKTERVNYELGKELVKLLREQSSYKDLSFTYKEQRNEDIMNFIYESYIYVYEVKEDDE